MINFPKYIPLGLHSLLIRAILPTAFYNNNLLYWESYYTSYKSHNAETILQLYLKLVRFGPTEQYILHNQTACLPRQHPFKWIWFEANHPEMVFGIWLTLKLFIVYPFPVELYIDGMDGKLFSLITAYLILLKIGL